ncbi:NADAR family protein [Vibrio cincinnatiensis]|uniref:NADAR family protein n=1 Tax=Vibrio cincinnatiensis TaxID=675 RepID=UPI001EDE9444|nr:NADAR family protein [Vibrio cincinnatiensis]MCG3727582.1 NADAR family protein [Vibrio cincinnatiensis]
MSMSFSKKMYRSYPVQESCVFFRTKEQWGELSNMSNDFPFVIDGITIHSSEALYQALKFQNFPLIQEEILRQDSAKLAKNIAKKNGDFACNDKRKHLSYMGFSLYCKYKAHNEYFSQLLDNTRDKAIVEMSYNDVFWGATPNGDVLGGINALGRLWMQLREERLDISIGKELMSFELIQKEVNYVSTISSYKNTNQIDLI